MSFPNLNSRVHIFEGSYSKMMDFAQDHPRNEIIGVFFGKIRENGDIDVLEVYPFRVGKHTEVHFKDSDYEKVLPIIKDCSSRDLEWLGWFHSHPFKHGDHLYMSNTDIFYQYPAQIQNPFWTAIICNPHQINDSSTSRGMRAFRLYYDLDVSKLTKKVIEVPILIEK
ncbi:MAG: Mov34/MPN/PAD-1 family protein [Promethearchaeota archaeon]